MVNEKLDAWAALGTRPAFAKVTKKIQGVPQTMKPGGCSYLVWDQMLKSLNSKQTARLTVQTCDSAGGTDTQDAAFLRMIMEHAGVTEAAVRAGTVFLHAFTHALIVDVAQLHAETADSVMVRVCCQDPL